MLPCSPTTPMHSDPTTPSTTEMGFFQQAHDFVPNNPALTDISNIYNENVYNGNGIHSTHSIVHKHSSNIHNPHVRHRNEAMEMLSRHSIAGAEFDSSARDPPPRCHPGTRQKIIQRMDEWCRNPQRRLLWLRGAAGVGKSAIMQTFAETRPNSTMLGASLFFSQKGGRAKAAGAIPMLAYQLAIQLPEYRSYISELIDLDPNIFGKSLREQFQKFISQPFSTSGLPGDEENRSILIDGLDECEENRLILIDGLDECEDQQAQCELVMLITEFVQSVPAAPLLWVLSSRPEYHLCHIFDRPGIKGTFTSLSVPADGAEACMDVERFLRRGFENIQAEFPDIIPPTCPWPSERQFLAIALAANGLFVFAATVLKYVGDGSFYGDPVSQLDAVLSAINHHGSKDSGDHPLALVDALYTHIFSSVPARFIPVLHQILGFYILRGTSSSVPLVVIANILGIPQHLIYSALQRLHSVLDVPPPCDAHKKPLRFFHKSLGDYLMDSNRSGCFWLDMGKQGIKIAQCYVQKLDIALCTDHGVPAIPLSWDCPAEKNLNMQVLHEVKQSWYQVLPKVFIKFASEDLCTELEAFLDVFGKLRFNALDIGDAFGFFNLLNWIVSDPLPVAWNKLIVDQIPLENFSLDCVDRLRTSVYYQTNPACWGYWSANAALSGVSEAQPGGPYRGYGGISLSEEELLKDLEVLKKKYGPSAVKVLIIGFDPSKRCAVLVSPEEKREARTVIRYYFPLNSREFGSHLF